MGKTQERRDFWGAELPLTPSEALDHLADMVLKQSAARSPKWKFRLAPDLILEIQPKTGVDFSRGQPRTKDNLVPIQWFACRAFQGDGIVGAAFVDAKAAKAFWRFTFKIRGWSVKRKQIGWPSGNKDHGFPIFVALQDRIAAAFEAGFFDSLEPSKMMGSHCLYCGKGLTDPVSRARLIGPECFGSSSESLPFVTRLQVAA